MDRGTALPIIIIIIINYYPVMGGHSILFPAGTVSVTRLQACAFFFLLSNQNVSGQGTQQLFVSSSLIRPEYF